MTYQDRWAGFDPLNIQRLNDWEETLRNVLSQAGIHATLGRELTDRDAAMWSTDAWEYSSVNDLTLPDARQRLDATVATNVDAPQDISRNAEDAVIAEIDALIADETYVGTGSGQPKCDVCQQGWHGLRGDGRVGALNCPGEFASDEQKLAYHAAVEAQRIVDGTIMIPLENNGVAEGFSFNENGATLDVIAYDVETGEWFPLKLALGESVESVDSPNEPTREMGVMTSILAAIDATGELSDSTGWFDEADALRDDSKVVEPQRD